VYALPVIAFVGCAVAVSTVIVFPLVSC
jgi:hypothetical protein